MVRLAHDAAKQVRFADTGCVPFQMFGVRSDAKPPFALLIALSPPGDMPMRRSFAITCAAASLVLAATAIAEAGTPLYKGNDTGGIIAYPWALEIDARELVIAHCAAYGKIPKLNAVQARYGGYVSFSCVWPRPRPYSSALRVAY
jgi:hypothetical protein